MGNILLSAQNTGHVVGNSILIRLLPSACASLGERPWLDMCLVSLETSIYLKYSAQFMEWLWLKSTLTQRGYSLFLFNTELHFATGFSSLKLIDALYSCVFPWLSVFFSFTMFHFHTAFSEPSKLWPCWIPSWPFVWSSTLHIVRAGWLMLKSDWNLFTLSS